MDMNQENRSDELSLLELFNVLLRYKRLLVGLPLAGAILATLLVYFVLHPTWEASATLEIGHIGQAAQVPSTLVEPISNVMSRIVLPSFTAKAINYAGVKPDELKTMPGYYGTLKVAQVKGAELIEIKLRGPSAEMANKLIQGLIINLQNVHSEMMASTIDKNGKQLQTLTADIQKLSAEEALLKQKLFATHDWNAFDATLTATILKDKSNALREMIQRKLSLEEQISPSHTYNTRVLEEIDVSGGPVSPNKALIIELSIFLGLFGAVVIAFAHNALTSKAA
jgi:capsular polysaccharide biosynthesis protein